MNIQNRLLRSVHVWDVQEGTRVFLFATYPLFTLGTGMNLQSALRVCNFEHPELVSGNIYKNPLNIWGVKNHGLRYTNRRNRWNSHDVP
jgi:hypothetical protein